MEQFGERWNEGLSKEELDTLDKDLKDASAVRPNFLICLK